MDTEPTSRPRAGRRLPGSPGLSSPFAGLVQRLGHTQPPPPRTPIPAHLQGAQRAAWVQQQAQALATAAAPQAKQPAHTEPAQPAPPSAADWQKLTDAQRATAQQLAPSMRDVFVRMMAKLPPGTAAPMPPAAAPVATRPKAQPAAAPPARPRPTYRYREPGDHMVADATWLAFELAALPCMRQAEKGRTPPTVPQLVKLRYKKSSWKAAVATLLHRAPGTIKASPVAFVLAMARQMEAGTAYDPRRDEHWFAVDCWPQRMRDFATRSMQQ